MKTKTLITLAAACVILGTGFWLILHRGKKGTTAPSMLTKPEVTRAAPPNVGFPSGQAKMVTVGGPSKSQNTFLSPIQAPWTQVQAILDSKELYHNRMVAIDRLPTSISALDSEALTGFLLGRDPLDNEQIGQILKNQLMDRLCAMAPPPTGLGDVLIKIYHDRQQNSVIRDYAVQHITALDQQLETNAANGDERQRLQKILWEALGETEDSIAGTALLGLMRLSEDDPQIEKNELAKAALKMAVDVSASELSHITAYEVCAELNVRDALPKIEAAAQNSQTLSIQISAIGALGTVGAVSDIPLLERLSSEERLKTAAQHALARINLRRDQGSGGK